MIWIDLVGLCRSAQRPAEDHRPPSSPASCSPTCLALPNNSGEGGPVVRGWDPAKKNDILGYSVTVTGSDCYKATFGMGEISPFFGGKAVLVSLAQSAAALGDPTTPPASGPLGSGGRDGFARINNPVDQRGGRRVSNCVEIRVVAPPDSPLKILDGF